MTPDAGWIKRMTDFALNRKQGLPQDRWNRAQFRAGGLQGRRGAKQEELKTVRSVKGMDDEDRLVWRGHTRGSFFGPSKRPGLYMSHAEDWLSRAMRRSVTSRGRLKRTLARERAKGNI